MDSGLSGVSAMADWMDGEVDIPEQTLSNAQVFALLRMTEALKDRTVLLSAVELKDSIAVGDMVLAEQVWTELSEDEKTALWVAPKFGGIFTSEERSIIKGGFNASQ